MSKPYLSKTSLEDAKVKWFAALNPPPSRPEVVSTVEALGRVTAKAIAANRAVPHVRASAMDGIAVRAVDTAEARIDRPLSFRRNQDFVQVDTGDPLPEGFDAVIMLEDLDFVDEYTVEFRKAAFPGQHLRPTGEDFLQGDTILECGQMIKPETVAACLAAAVLEVEVKPIPKALAIPTGSELASPMEELPAGKYPETNSMLFHGYLKKWKAAPTLHPLLEDDADQIRTAVEQGVLNSDIVLINAGTSKGREDFTTSVIQEFGEVVVHGVAMHPGHPTVLGVINGKPVVGVPGYAVATWITLDQFVRPWLERYYGCPLDPQHTARGTLARRVHSPLGEVEFIRVRLERSTNGLIVHQLTGKASALSSLIRADGLLTVPAALSGYQQGDEVEVRLLD